MSAEVEGLSENFCLAFAGTRVNHQARLHRRLRAGFSEAENTELLQLVLLEGQKNLFDEAMMVLAAYGFSFAQIKWAGIRDKEWWPLYQLFDILNVWWNPKSGIEPVPEGTVIVGEDYVMDWNATYHKWQMHLLPEMPDKMNDNPCLINND